MGHFRSFLLPTDPPDVHRPRFETPAALMTHPQAPDLAEPLRRLREGEEEAMAELTPLIYDELRRLAAARLRREADRGSIGATDLVHEVYLKLVGNLPDPRDRGHFLAIASRLMRQVLVDRARYRLREKRGADQQAVSLDEALHATDTTPAAMLRLDEALRGLAALEPRLARCIELFYFGGMNYDEIAAATECSKATVNRDLQLARAWLRRELAT